MNRILLKQNAKKQLSRNLGTMMLCFVILGIFIAIDSLYGTFIGTKIVKDNISLFMPGFNLPVYNNFTLNLDTMPVLKISLLIWSIAMFIFSPALTLGLHDVYLKSQKGERVMFSQMFQKFDQFGKAFVMNLLIVIFTILKFLLLIIPGIIAIYQYSMSYFVLADNPELGAYEAIKQSKELMKGHKFELFVLWVSFFWWDILTVITFGLANLYVAPYYAATVAEFYNKIKQEKEESISENV